MTESEVVWKGAEKCRQYLVPLDSLELTKGNPRRGDVEAIAGSFREFGQTHPIVTNLEGQILAGNHRCKAARSLGWTHIAAVDQEFASKEAELKYLLVDNDVSERGYSVPKEQLSLAEAIGDDDVDTESMRNRALLGRAKRDELVQIAELSTHERNYRQHDEHQLKHLTESLKANGLYRNVVIAQDGTILAGHGLVEAAKRLGITAVPVTRLECEPDSPEALKVVAGDNELSRLSEMNDRALTDMLKEVHEKGDATALLGTGYDAQTLANLVTVTRHASEVRDFDAGAEWVGLPEFDSAGARIQIIISFESEEKREEFRKKMELEPHYRKKQVWSTWWPPREREDLKSLKFDLEDEQAPSPLDELTKDEEALFGTGPGLVIDDE